MFSDSSLTETLLLSIITNKMQVEKEMTVKPYEREADREARRKAEEEKRRREEEAKGANDKIRALEVRWA